jgi:uncharacterized protein YycO
MRTYQHQSVTKSRKRKRCDWCGELIDVGQPYDSYRFVAFGNAGTARMHPECNSASGDVVKQEGSWVVRGLGEFRRGSTDSR